MALLSEADTRAKLIVPVTHARGCTQLLTPSMSASAISVGIRGNSLLAFHREPARVAPNQPGAAVASLRPQRRQHDATRGDELAVTQRAGITAEDSADSAQRGASAQKDRCPALDALLDHRSYTASSRPAGLCTLAPT